MLHFDPAELRAVVAEIRANQCALVLAKDDGVYLMPAVGERNDTGRIKHLAYADGCHPQRDDAWHETSRQLVGGDDFGEELVLTDSCIERILSQEHELWIHLLPETVYMHVAAVNWVGVADYRRVTARMLQLAEAHYSVCVSLDEFKSWRERAINLLATACHTDCKRAKPTDREDYLAMFERLKLRVDTVNPKGALRYPAF